MDFSDVLALTALVVSIVSAFFSHRAHRQTTDLQLRETRREFNRERSEFLVTIEKSTRLFEKVKIRIGELLSEIEKQPEDVRASIAYRVDQLKSDQDYLEGCLRQSNALWQENFDMTHDGLALHKPRHLGLLEDDEEFAKSASKRVDEITTELHQSIAIFHPLGG